MYLLNVTSYLDDGLPAIRLSARGPGDLTQPPPPRVNGWQAAHMASEDFRILDDTGALVVADDGTRVIVFDRETSKPATVAFVMVIVAVVCVGFGAVQLVEGAAPALVAVILWAVGLAAAAVAVLLVLRIRRRRALPLAQCRTVAVLDRRRGLFSSAGGALVGLDQVRFERRMQLVSSAPKLVAVTPGGVRVLKRGNPFDGGVGRAHEVLTSAARASARQA